MHVCPAFSSLPDMSRGAASARSASGANSAGDLPPSSSVTGVRFAAAASATCRPTAVEPVKNRWSNGSCENARPTSAPPSTTANSSSSKCSATSSRSTSDVAGVMSDGFSSTRLPAASAPIAGASASCTG